MIGSAAHRRYNAARRTQGVGPIVGDLVGGERSGNRRRSNGAVLKTEASMKILKFLLLIQRSASGRFVRAALGHVGVHWLGMVISNRDDRQYCSDLPTIANAEFETLSWAA